jgi:hypothetical protein
MRYKTDLHRCAPRSLYSLPSGLPSASQLHRRGARRACTRWFTVGKTCYERCIRLLALHAFRETSVVADGKLSDQHALRFRQPSLTGAFPIAAGALPIAFLRIFYSFL